MRGKLSSSVSSGLQYVYVWIRVLICFEALVSELEDLDINQNPVACNHFIPVCMHSLLHHDHICVLKGTVSTYIFVFGVSMRTIEIQSTYAEIKFLQRLQH